MRINKIFILIGLVIIYIFTMNLTISAFDITIEKEVKVKKDRILLRDIAEFKNIDKDILNNIESIDLGKAPLPGYKKYLSKELIKLMLKKSGFNLQKNKLDIPDQVIIKRDYKIISSQLIEKHIKKYISKKISNKVDQYSIEINFNKNKIKIPNQEFKFIVLENRNIKMGQMILPAAIIINEKEYKRFYIPVKIKAYKYAYIATKYISQGSLIRRKDYQYKLVQVKNLEDNKIIKKDSNIFNQNIQLSYSLKEGDILKKNNYKNPFVINWGDRIQAEVIVGNVKISLMVIARERGKKGDYINVENPENNYDFQAQIISSQLVQLIKN